MVGPAAGISLVELRTALVLTRQDGDGITWSPAEWARVWERLTPRQQAVIYLHVVVGLTQADVGEQLDLSRSSVQGAWIRGLARIRDALPD